MQYALRINGRTRHVILSRVGEGWHATVDGAAFEVDAAIVDGARLSLVVGDGNGTGRSVPAVVVPGREAATLDVAVNGTTVSVLVESPERSRRRAGAAGADSGPQRITAPMPGKVVRVLVAPGDTVTARQGLVVVEAMKMENELRAARPGRVATVSVTEGQSVDAGAVLAVVE